jgi:spermidine/putrescine transport system permease protein
MPKLKQTDISLSEAALDLGCTSLQSFFKVVLPNISSGIFTGLIMAFTLSLDDFVISYFTCGHYQTLPIVIYNMTKKTVTPDVYALSTFIFISIFVLLILYNVVQTNGEKRRAGR